MAKISKTMTGRSRRKRDPLPPVIKVRDLGKSFPQQVAAALAPQPTFGDEMLRLLRSIDRSLKLMVDRDSYL